MNDTAKEWSEMDAQEKQHMLDRLHAAVDTKSHAAPTLRQRLANGSRSGLAARLEQSGA